ncbi:helix-turn-helix domain-containing protein [Gordonia sinesedis]
MLPHPACTLSVEWGDTRPEVGADPVVVTGVATRRFDVELAGTGRVFAAKFRPGGLAALTSGTASAWRDATFAAVDIFPASLLAPLRDLDPLDNSEQCAQRFDEVLRAAVASAPDSAATEGGYAQVLRVVRDMLDDHTLVGVGQVERRHGLGTRQLQRLFARYVGVSPKWVLARFRMHDAVVELDAGFRGSLADLAVRHGWYDQSHFTRDFRRLVGVAPGAYIARPR